MSKHPGYKQLKDLLINLEAAMAKYLKEMGYGS